MVDAALMDLDVWNWRSQFDVEYLLEKHHSVQRASLKTRGKANRNIQVQREIVWR